MRMRLKTFLFSNQDEGDGMEEQTLSYSFFFSWRRGVDRRTDMMIIMHVDATGKIALVLAAAGGKKKGWTVE